MISDGVLDLIEAGVVTNARKPADRNLTVTGAALGSRRLFEALGRREEIVFRPVSSTHAPATLASVGRLCAINSAVEIDLSGQANAEAVDGRLLGAVGGQVDFLRGAAACGGTPVLALPAIDAFGHGTPVIEVAQAAERAGLDHAWVPDHLVFHRPVLEATTALAVVAGATDRIRLGSAILNPTLRPVTWLAKHLATLEALAPGRLLLGVGLGGEYEPEFRAAGVDPRTRARRLDEALELLPRLMAGEAVRH